MQRQLSHNLSLLSLNFYGQLSISNCFSGMRTGCGFLVSFRPFSAKWQISHSTKAPSLSPSTGQRSSRRRSPLYYSTRATVQVAYTLCNTAHSIASVKRLSPTRYSPQRSKYLLHAPDNGFTTSSGITELWGMLKLPMIWLPSRSNDFWRSWNRIL